jgi:hypothetical protein
VTPAAALTAFQITVAKLFFSMPQSDGFLLAGGAALAAQDLTSRPTRDLDLFTRAGGPSVPHAQSAVGPTFGLEELAGRKVIALFDRAEARDFADVCVLAQRYDTELLLRRAAEIDGGFDRAVFASMLASLDRFTDPDIPVPVNSVTELRTFFRRWASQLCRPSAGNGS